MRKEECFLSISLVVVACVCLPMLVGCERGGRPGTVEEGKSALCSPHWCDGGCGDDGCGGTCGCQGGTACSVAAQCVASTECHDTCQSAGWQCGTVCGVSCGTCGSGQQCFWHKCYTPPVAESCPDCAVRLSLVGKEVTGENLTKVVLAIDYTPTPQAPARMADFWIYANADVELAHVELGSGLADAGKSFFVDPVSHNAWKRRADRSFQLLALSLTNTNPIASGRLATLEFTLNTAGPVPFKLLRHETLAPTAANNALDSLPFDSAVVVTAK